MFSAILALLLLPVTDVSRSRGMQFRPLSKIAFYMFIANFLILMQLGAKHVESPFIEFGQLSTALYFLYFSVIMYGVTLVENTLVDILTISDYKLSVHILKSSIPPKGVYAITNYEEALTFLKYNISYYKNVINKLSNHKMELNNLTNIAIMGDKQEISPLDRKNWEDVFNPTNFMDTGSYVKFFNLFKTETNSKHLDLVFKLNNSVKQYCTFALISSEKQLCSLEKGEPNFVTPQDIKLLGACIGIFELENTLLHLILMGKEGDVMFKEFVLELHNEIATLNSADFGLLDNSTTVSIKNELLRLTHAYPL